MKLGSINAEVGQRLIEVKIGEASVRNIRAGLMQLAYALAERPGTTGYLVMSDTVITDSRIGEESSRALAVLNKDIAARINLCVEKDGRLRGVLHSIDLDTKGVLLDVLAHERARKGPLIARSDASFVILKVLIHHWLTNGDAVTSDWLARTSGYSYPTIASALRRLGSLIERQSDRKVRLRWFPQEEYLRLLAMSDRARATARYADASGQSRSPERHLKRLELLNPRGVAVGGVFGAKHYFKDLDIVGAPRLDLSFHAREPDAATDFIHQLDPALKRISDPREPASVVVHQIYHADPLFEDRDGGLKWADPVECLLDLHDAKLEMQAKQFLQFMRQRIPNGTRLDPLATQVGRSLCAPQFSVYAGGDL